MRKAVQIQLKSFTYEDCGQPVLKDVDFYMEYGQITLLSGVSGSGKSTLLSLINGVIPRMVSGKLDGTIQIDGEEVTECSMSCISRKAGSVLQNAEAQIIHQVVEDEIAFGCENFGIHPELIEQRVEQGCHAMGIHRHWKTRTLSGGQKQRLVTASTLAMETKVLIFDEPLANLDQKGALDLLKLLRELAGQGRAILLVEHRLDVVLPYVDVVWEMRESTVRIAADKEAYLQSQVSMIKDKTEDCHSNQILLKIRGLGKSYGSRSILKDLNAEIYEGERILLLGENGCGKSTLLQILARLQKADIGTVEQRIDPKLGKRANKRWFQAVGVVYQNPDYQLFMPTVEEEISFGTKDRTYALEIADRFGIRHLLQRHPHSLSEGQKRRVTIASIMARKPRILLLDEPTVGQDYAGLKQMVEVLNQIHQEQKNTMITVTHDFRCASALCDRSLWLEEGKVAHTGGKELAEQFFVKSYQKKTVIC